MANKSIFKTKTLLPVANITNNAGGKSYTLNVKESLSMLASCGTIHDTYYLNAETQLDGVLSLLKQCDNEFLCKLAIYSRQNSYMKDLPAFILAYLTTTNISSSRLTYVFNKVCSNMKMLRNFVQIMRSGKVGRKSLGTRPKRLVQQWLNSQSTYRLFQDSVGQDPSLVDIIKMTHPAPIDVDHNIFYSYILNNNKITENNNLFPSNLIAFERIKNGIMPESFDGIDFRKLSSVNIPNYIYKEVVKSMSWTTLRMNLNAIAEKGIFTDDKSIVDYVSNKLSDEAEVLKSKVFPYQLYTTFQNLRSLVPIKIKNALQIAIEHSTKNIPTLNNEECLILLDISGSMNSPITGNRGSVTTKTTNMDAASVLTASLLRKNPNSQIITFNDHAETRFINTCDSIMTIANTLSKLCAGGTSTSSSLHLMNTLAMKYKNIIMISDNQSWMDSNDCRHTNSLYEWNKYTKRVKDAKMVCLNITPYSNTQIPDRDNVLNIGGFSDQFFTIIDEFFRYGKGRDRWVKLIEKIDLPT